VRELNPTASRKTLNIAVWVTSKWPLMAKNGYFMRLNEKKAQQLHAGLLSFQELEKNCYIT
jgi:hypothetical protein